MIVHNPLTLGGMIAMGAVIAIMKAIRPKKRSRPTSVKETHKEEAQENIDEMTAVVNAHKGYTAEVINVNVFGKRAVETFRLLRPGRAVEIRRNRKGDLKVYAYGEHICELIPAADSNIPRLLDDGIPFEAYLGGRDMAMMYSDTIDFCSIIIFYRIDGIPPTTVNIRD